MKRVFFPKITSQHPHSLQVANRVLLPRASRATMEYRDLPTASSATFTASMFLKCKITESIFSAASTASKFLTVYCYLEYLLSSLHSIQVSNSVLLPRASRATMEYRDLPTACSASTTASKLRPSFSRHLTQKVK